MPTEFFLETVDDSGDVHGQVSLAVGDAERPTIAYTTTSGEVRLAEATEDGWVVSTLLSDPADLGPYRVSLALDRHSEPHVAYVSAHTDRLIYGARSVNWQFEEVPTEAGLLPGPVRFPSMKLYRGVLEVTESGDPLVGIPYMDAPHVVYVAGLSLHHAVKQRRRDSPESAPVWRKNVELLDEGGLVEKGWFASLNFDGRDNLRIAYLDEMGAAGFSRRRLLLATRPPNFTDDPNTWEFDVLDGGEVLAEAPALAHSVGGEAIISYFDHTARALKICLFGNFPESPFVAVVSDNVEGGGHFWSSVAMSHDFKISVVYTSDGRLQFAQGRLPGAFTIEDVDSGGRWPSIVFDDEGSAQVAHVDGGVLKYAKSPHSDG